MQLWPGDLATWFNDYGSGAINVKASKQVCKSFKRHYRSPVKFVGSQAQLPLSYQGRIDIALAVCAPLTRDFVSDRY